VANHVRVMVIDAQPLVRSGIRVALAREQGFVIVEEGESIVGTSGADPDVVVLGTGHGSASARSILERWPMAAVLMLSASADPVLVRRLFELGVTGIVLPTVDDNELIRAMRIVASGGRYVTPGVGAVLAEGDQHHNGVAALSARERDVLRLLALGLTNQQIADELVVSIRTVEGHRANLMTKLGATSRAELVRHALKVGLLDDELSRS
jgi:two-component system response regulator NreC